MRSETKKQEAAKRGIPGIVVPELDWQELDILNTPVEDLTEDQLFTGVPFEARVVNGIDKL